MAGLVETARHPRTAAASAVQMAVVVDTFLDVAVAVHNLWLPSQVVAAAADVAESERPGSQSFLEQTVPPVVAAVAHDLAYLA